MKPSVPIRFFVVYFILLHLAAQSVARADDELVVYPPVPGLAASEHYMARVRSAGADSEWQNAFAWETACKSIEKKTDGYFDTLAGWTHTYVNFETAGAVEIEIARVNGQPIRSAAVHPRRKASACSVRDGKVFVRLDQPCLVAVDIDGQMDAQDTGKGYKGPPLHTISLFANPLLAGKPKPDDPGVLIVKPGEMPPSDGPWSTLYFLPGVHDVGLAFPLRANRQYYIPGEAIVYGTLSNQKWGDGHHIRIFGLGTLSGARLKHPKYVEPAISEDAHKRYRPIELMGTTDTLVEGITIADSATHSLMLIHPYKAGHPNEVKWTKIFTWRANGDGINPFGNTLIEDCFLRTQDDSLYVNGLGIRRTVLWNDANGSSFVLSIVPQLAGRPLVVEDCDVIYSRAKWHHWTGGRVFNMRGEGAGAGGTGVIFRNINIEDPRPTLQQFFLCMTVPKPYSKDAEKGPAGDLSGILFQNIAIAAPSVLGEPQLLWGQPDARIRNLTFENLTVGGKPVRDSAFFKTNEFVEGLSFGGSTVSHAAPPGSDKTKLDITYKTTAQGPLRLDLHYPAEPKSGTKYPLVIFTHGGGWTTGDKSVDHGVRFQGVSAITAQGFCVASVEYRLWSKDGDIVIRDCVTDAKDALRFLAKNEQRFSLDASRVFTFGDSAGGHIALMLLLSPQESFPGDPALVDAKYRLVAGVSWYGPCDFEKSELFNPDGHPNFRDRFGPRIIQAGTGAKKKLAAFREVSPVNYLRADSPPLLMVQGDKDTTIPVLHAHYMQERANAVKAPVEILIVRNAEHNWREAGGTLSFSRDEIATKTAAFLRQQLAKASSK